MPKIGKNTKGNDVIEHENFLYKYHKPLNSTKNRHRWVCTNVYKKCSAYAYTIGRKIPICFELKNEHTCANPFKSSSNDVKSSELEDLRRRYDILAVTANARQQDLHKSETRCNKLASSNIDLARKLGELGNVAHIYQTNINQLIDEKKKLQQELDMAQAALQEKDEENQ
nr:unnamed protein product [Meloidogyne enterolobii]